MFGCMATKKCFFGTLPLVVFVSQPVSCKTFVVNLHSYQAELSLGHVTLASNNGYTSTPNAAAGKPKQLSQPFTTSPEYLANCVAEM